MESGVIQGIPLHRQGSPEESRRREPTTRSPSSSHHVELAPYASPISPEGEYPPELPMQPVEIPLEEGRYRFFV